jgi:hypothetical protein
LQALTCLTLPNLAVDAPTAQIFLAAFSSRPLTDWQDGQRHALTDKSRLDNIKPQCEQVLLDGYQGLIKMICLPFFVATHSRISRNSPKAKSEIFLPQSRCIPFRFSVSKHKTSNLSVKL